MEKEIVCNCECGCGKQNVDVEEGDLSKETGHVYYTNNWGQTLKWLTIRHRRSNDSGKEETITIRNVESKKDIIYAMDINYETGVGSSFDYWYIQFETMDGKKYDVKDNFYCSISASDNGNAILTIYPKDKMSLYVSFSKSDGCSVSIKQSS